MDSSLTTSEGINPADTLIQNSSLQIVRLYISVVKTPEFMVLCDDNPNKVKHACEISGPILANLFNWFKCDLFKEAFLSSYFLFSFIYLFIFPLKYQHLRTIYFGSFLFIVVSSTRM